MELLLISTVVFGLSQICLSILLFSRNKTQLVLEEWLFILFLITGAAFLFTPVLENHWLEPFRKVIENFLPGVFWLLCCCLFDDGFKIRPIHIVLVVITVAVPLAGLLLNKFGMPVGPLFFETLPQILEFVLLGLALFAIIRNWNDDLVEIRRDLRLWFCATTGVCIVGLIILREIVNVEYAWFEVAQYMPVSLICLVINLLIVHYRPGLLNSNAVLMARKLSTPAEPLAEVLQEEEIDGSQVIQVQHAEVEVPLEVIEQLMELMEEQHIYREMGLTIGRLAELLEVPEYRLRRIINAGLGYRNFNDFLNGFRIIDAGERLADPKQSGEAILNIALDTGFRSLSSFNKAFRESFGVTPTVYRQQQNKKGKQVA